MTIFHSNFTKTEAKESRIMKGLLFYNEYVNGIWFIACEC